MAAVGWYALFGLVLGFAGLLPRGAGTPRLVITGMAMIGVWAAARGERRDPLVRLARGHSARVSSWLGGRVAVFPRALARSLTFRILVGHVFAVWCAAVRVMPSPAPPWDKLAGDRLSLTLRVIDPFNMARDRSATIDPEFVQINDRTRAIRALQLNAAWMFGRPNKTDAEQ